MVTDYILTCVDVADPVQYEQYKTLSTKAMQARGAELLVRGGKTESLGGGRNPTRIIVLKFPSCGVAKTFCNSEKYYAARNARTKTANMNVIVIEGI